MKVASGPVIDYLIDYCDKNMYDILIRTLIRAHGFPVIFLDSVGSRSDPEPCGSCLCEGSPAGWARPQLQLQHPAGEIRSARRAAHCCYLAGILHGFPHTEFEKCPGLPGTGPWTLSAPLCPEVCDRGGAVELRAR